MKFFTKSALVVVTVSMALLIGWQYVPYPPPEDPSQSNPPANPSNTVVEGDTTTEGTGDADPSPAPRREYPTPPTSVQAKLIIPVSGIAMDELVDTFSQARDGGTREHEGIDIMAPTGTPIVSASRGTVEKLFLSNAGGKTVYIRSKDRERLYYYAHLDSYAPDLSEGQTIDRGESIGTVGYSGNANAEAPHLHFEIREISPEHEWYENSVPLNPYLVLSSR